LTSSVVSPGPSDEDGELHCRLSFCWSSFNCASLDMQEDKLPEIGVCIEVKW
jgi:hypothetical protein